MQETETTEMLKRKEEKKKRKRREAIIFVCICTAIEFIIGVAVTYHQGVFDGYQLALKQFHIIASDLPRLLP